MRNTTDAELRGMKAVLACAAFSLPTAAPRALALIIARAVIRSMYEPDDTMLKAYMDALEQPANDKKEPWHKAKMRKRWRAMIDAASPP